MELQRKYDRSEPLPPYSWHGARGLLCMASAASLNFANFPIVSSSFADTERMVLKILFVENEIGGFILFIRVVPYDPFWEVEYENESQKTFKIKNILKDILVEVYHIGSTAVKGLAAKSIIDIMPVVTNISLVDKHNKEFVAIGYECMGEFGIEGRRYFRKGGDNRTHQIHIFEQSNHKDINRHIAVRDFLRTHPDIALEYGELKMELAYRFSEDIEGYCTGKDAFVKQLEKDALLWYQNNESYKTR